MRESEHPQRERREALCRIQEPQHLIPRDITLKEIVDVFLAVAFIVLFLLALKVELG